MIPNHSNACAKHGAETLIGVRIQVMIVVVAVIMIDGSDSIALMRRSLRPKTVVKKQYHKRKKYAYLYLRSPGTSRGISRGPILV
jgi:hypothetical protein